MRNGESNCGDTRKSVCRNTWLVLILIGSLFRISSPLFGSDQSNLKPVVVRVVDDVTRLPVTHFTYNGWIETATNSGTLIGEGVRVESKDGGFEIPAPASCRITIEALAPDYIPGYNNHQNFEIRSDDLVRQIEVRLEPGILLRGKVRDKRTQLPVVGAIVVPRIFTPPMWSPDGKRRVRTDAQGRFEVRGVDVFGVQISHSNYATASLDFYGRDMTGERPGSVVTRDVYLETAKMVKGIVTSPAGQPLENVKVEDGGGKIGFFRKVCVQTG